MNSTPDVLLIDATPDHRPAILDLFSAVIDADAAYAPAVANGTERLSHWVDRKPVDWTLLAITCIGEVVGHLSTRHTRVLPGGTSTPRHHNIELCRLVVHPDHQGVGIGKALIEFAHLRHTNHLWATCHTGYRAHWLLSHLGWTDHTTVHWEDDPRPGTCLLAPRHLRKATT